MDVETLASIERRRCPSSGISLHAGEDPFGVDCVSHVRMTKHARVALRDAAGNRTRCTWGIEEASNNSNDAIYRVDATNGIFLDSPNTTSAITYQVQWASEGGATGYLNRPVTQDSVGANVASTITAMEVAA